MMIGAPGRVDTVQLTEKTDKGRALARPRKGSFSGTNAEKQADDPLRGLIRYNNFRKLKSKQKKTWFAALW